MAVQRQPRGAAERYPERGVLAPARLARVGLNGRGIDSGAVKHRGHGNEIASGSCDESGGDGRTDAARGVWCRPRGQSIAEVWARRPVACVTATPGQLRRCAPGDARTVQGRGSRRRLRRAVAADLARGEGSVARRLQRRLASRSPLVLPRICVPPWLPPVAPCRV